MPIKRSHIAALHDIIMAAVSLVFSMYLRLGDGFHESYSFLPHTVISFTAVCAVVFSFMGLYKGVWRYASLQDLVNIGKAVALATLIFLPVMFMITRLEDFPRSVLVINVLVLMALLGGPRILYRMIKDKNVSFSFLESGQDDRTPVILVGVSDNAVNFIRNASEYKVVAIIDEKKSRVGRNIHGITVYGDIDSIPKTIKCLKREHISVKNIILSEDYIDKEKIQRVLKISETFGISLAKLPRISDFKSDVSKLEIKPIAIEDLLGRAPKQPMLGRREELIKGKRILVTGAGGTIGSELVRQIASYNPAEITLLEISEINLYKIDKELENNFPEVVRHSLIGDIRDINFLEKLFSTRCPQIVFHAAALKHVPIVEENLVEAALTNVIGSKNIADLSLKYKADRMVMISTDKAVHPTSLMGVTKRVAECYVQGLSHANKNNHTVFSTVRFGNVLGSSGSVIPLFQSQLEKGGPITVTHPDMVRYFMTVPEAVELVLQASTLTSGQSEDKSSIFVLDMGQPVRILDMATQMIKLAGLRPEIDIKIEYTGIRKGEKLYEELFYSNEEKQKTLYEGVLLASARAIDYEDIKFKIDQLFKSCIHRRESEVLSGLLQIVPEYQSEEAVAA